MVLHLALVNVICPFSSTIFFFFFLFRRMRLSQDSSRLPFCLFFGRFTSPGSFWIFFPFRSSGPGIVRPDSSCKSFLVSCQAVTNPLLVGKGGRWVLKDLFRPKVSFQHLPSVLASFSGFLVSLSTSRSALGGSSANGLHP